MEAQGRHDQGGIEAILTAGPPRAQISVRILVPLLFALSLLEITALAWTSRMLEVAYQRSAFKEPTGPAAAWLRAAEIHRSLPGIAGGVILTALILVMARRGVFDSNGRWICLGLLGCMTALPAVYAVAILGPWGITQGGL